MYYNEKNDESESCMIMSSQYSRLENNTQTNFHKLRLAYGVWQPCWQNLLRGVKQVPSAASFRGLQRITSKDVATARTHIKIKISGSKYLYLVFLKCVGIVQVVSTVNNSPAMTNFIYLLGFLGFFFGGMLIVI